MGGLTGKLLVNHSTMPPMRSDAGWRTTAHTAMGLPCPIVARETLHGPRLGGERGGVGTGDIEARRCVAALTQAQRGRASFAYPIHPHQLAVPTDTNRSICASSVFVVSRGASVVDPPFKVCRRRGDTQLQSRKAVRSEQPKKPLHARNVYAAESGSGGQLYLPRQKRERAMDKGTKVNVIWTTGLLNGLIVVIGTIRTSQRGSRR